MKEKDTIEKNEKKSKKVNIDNYVLPEYVESWIQGYPLKTEHGYIKPLKVKDYFKHIAQLELLKKQGWEIKRDILREVKGSIQEDMIKKDFENGGFIVCLKNNVAGLKTLYNSIFNDLVDGFDPKSFYWTITQAEFDDFRKMILDFNSVPYRDKNPNPEIEKFNRMKEYMAKTKGGVIEFDTIFTALMSGKGGGFTPDQINDMTYRQFMLGFKRIEFMIAHDTTILFKTVDAKDKVEIVDWTKSSREEDNGQYYESVDDLMNRNVFTSGRKATSRNGKLSPNGEKAVDTMFSHN